MKLMASGVGNVGTKNRKQEKLSDYKSKEKRERNKTGVLIVAEGKI